MPSANMGPTNNPWGLSSPHSKANRLMVATVSPEDKETTKRLVKAGELLGVPVLDHLVIGDGKYFSFKETGLL